MTINILSICWDYFVDVDPVIRINNFPDGGNEQLNPDILNFIWSNHYANYFSVAGKKLNDVAVLKQRHYDLLIDYLANKSNHLRAYYAYSHGILPQLLENIFNANIKFNIYNVDFHHDTYGPAKLKHQIDCGNWLSYLIDVKKVKAYWINDQYSNLENVNKKIKIIDFEELLKVDYFTMIFICRSDAWAPPHLDRHYIKLLDSMNAVNIQGYDTKYNRYDSVVPLVEESLNFYKNMISNL